MIRVLVMIFCMMPFCAWADEAELARKAMNIPTDLSIIPNYRGTDLKEAGLNAQSLAEEAYKKMGSDDHIAQMRTRLKERPSYGIDESDTLLQNGQRAVRHSNEIMKGESVSFKSGPDFEQTPCDCVESKPARLFEEIETRPETEVITKLVPKWIVSHYECHGHGKKAEGYGRHNGNIGACDSKVAIYKRIEVPQKQLIFKDFAPFSSALKDEVLKGRCKKIKEDCPVEIRIFEGIEKIACWQRKTSYECKIPKINECESLRKKGCVQIGSRCIQSLGNDCVKWQQRFSCPKGEKKEDLILEKGEAFQRKDPPLSFDQNDEFGEAVSALSILKNIETDLAQYKDWESLPQIFKGEASRCRIKFGNFGANCCVRGKKDEVGKGVLHDVDLTECDGEEKNLALLRAEGKCIECGTYCAEKIFGECTIKKRTYCCYPSLLTRLIQEQGRRQLGLGMGDPEHQDCRGLSVDEIQRIQFNRLNLGEFTQKVSKAFKDKVPQLEAMIKRKFNDHFQDMKGKKIDE